MTRWLIRLFSVRGYERCTLDYNVVHRCLMFFALRTCIDLAGTVHIVAGFQVKIEIVRPPVIRIVRWFAGMPRIVRSVSSTLCASGRCPGTNEMTIRSSLADLVLVLAIIRTATRGRLRPVTASEKTGVIVIVGQRDQYVGLIDRRHLTQHSMTLRI
jgi:hypothetical protein